MMISLLCLAFLLVLPLCSVVFRLLHASDSGIGKALRNILSGAILFGLIAPLIGYFCYAAYISVHLAPSIKAAINVFFTPQVFSFSLISYFFGGGASVLTGVVAGAIMPWIRTWFHLVLIGIVGACLQALTTVAMGFLLRDTTAGIYINEDTVPGLLIFCLPALIAGTASCRLLFGRAKFDWYSPSNATLPTKDSGAAQPISQHAKPLLLAVVIGCSCVGFARVILAVRFSPIDQWLAIPCFCGLIWAICCFKLSYLRSLIAPKNPLFLAFLFAVVYDVVSRYLQLQKIEYPFLLHTFIQLASAFFIGYFSKRTSEGIFLDGLVLLPIFFIWIAVAISAYPGAEIVGLVGAASVLAPILYIATIAGIYSNRESRVRRTQYAST